MYESCALHKGEVTRLAVVWCQAPLAGNHDGPPLINRIMKFKKFASTELSFIWPDDIQFVERRKSNPVV